MTSLKERFFVLFPFFHSVEDESKKLTEEVNGLRDELDKKVSKGDIPIDQLSKLALQKIDNRQKCQ